MTTMVANARFAPPWGRSDPATGGRRSRCAGHGRTGSVYDLHLLPTRGIGRRTSAWKTNQHGKGCCRGAPAYSWWTKAALVLAPLGQAVVGSPLWPRLSKPRRAPQGAGCPDSGEPRAAETRNPTTGIDMVAFLVAEQKLSAVSEWEAERHALVRLEADQRRAEQRLEGARALARMR